MIRAVLVVALTVALLAASVPVLEDARHGTTAGTTETELEELLTTARELVDSNDVSPDAPARRVITVRFPQRSWGDAGVERVRIEPGRKPGEDRLTYSVRGGHRRTVAAPGVALGTQDGAPLTLGPGRHRLVLALRGTPDAPVVVVRRFKPNDGASGSHASVAAGE